MLGGMRRQLVELLRLYPEHRENIMTGFYKHLKIVLQEDMWDEEFYRGDLDALLATPEARANLVIPTDPSLLKHLLQALDGHDTENVWRNPVIQRIRDLHRVESPPFVEYGVGMLLDADHRFSIRGAMNDTRLSLGDQEVLEEYYINRCTNQQLNPNGHWKIEHWSLLRDLATHPIIQLTDIMVRIDPRYSEYKDTFKKIYNIPYVDTRTWQTVGGQQLMAEQEFKPTMTIYLRGVRPYGSHVKVVVPQELRHLLKMNNAVMGSFTATYPI